MDRTEMQQALAAGRVRIVMNDGSIHIITAESEPSVSDIALTYLHRESPNDKWHHVYLPLVTMSQVQAEAPLN